MTPEDMNKFWYVRDALIINARELGRKGEAAEALGMHDLAECLSDHAEELCSLARDISHTVAHAVHREAQEATQALHDVGVAVLNACGVVVHEDEDSEDEEHSHDDD